MRARILSTLVLCLLGCFAVRDLALLAEDYVITLEDGSTYGKVASSAITPDRCAWISPT
jgi:hypothetical protein